MSFKIKLLYILYNTITRRTLQAALIASAAIRQPFDDAGVVRTEGAWQGSPDVTMNFKGRQCDDAGVLGLRFAAGRRWWFRYGNRPGGTSMHPSWVVAGSGFVEAWHSKPPRSQPSEILPLVPAKPSTRQSVAGDRRDSPRMANNGRRFDESRSLPTYLTPIYFGCAGTRSDSSSRVSTGPCGRA
jgi:hypothetical protein